MLMARYAPRSLLDAAALDAMMLIARVCWRIREMRYSALQIRKGTAVDAMIAALSAAAELYRARLWHITPARHAATHDDMPPPLRHGLLMAFSPRHCFSLAALWMLPPYRCARHVE